MFHQSIEIIESDLFTKIVHFALAQNRKALRDLVNSGISIDIHQNDQTPVYFLTYSGKYKAAKLLIKEFNASLDEAIKGAAEANDSEFTYQLIKEGASIDFAVEGAASGNHIRLLNELLALGGSINSALQGAAKKNQPPLLTRFLKDDNANNALWGAGIGAHVSLIHDLNKRNDANPSFALLGLSIIDEKCLSQQLIQEEGASIDVAVQGTAMGGHIASTLKYIQDGASLNDAILGAAAGGHIKLTLYLLNLKENKENMDFAVLGAILGEQIELLNLLVNNGANKETVVAAIVSDAFIKNEKKVFKMLSMINDYELRKNLITELTQKNSSLNKPFLIKTSHTNRMIRNYEFNYNQALYWVNLSSQERDLLCLWFLQGKQLIGKNLSYDIFIHISSYLTGLSNKQSKMFYNKITHDSLFFPSYKKQTFFGDRVKESKKVTRCLNNP